MKTIKITLLTITMLLCSIAVSAHDFEVDGIYYEITSDTDLTVGVTFKGKSYNSHSNEYTGEVVIPEKIIHANNTYSVTSIRSHAFEGCSNLVSIAIPKSIVSIGRYAFGLDGCSNVYITDLAAWCNIESESIGHPFVQNNGNHLYLNGKEIIDLEIPDSIKRIGNYAFQGCSNMASIVISNSVEYIGNNAFNGCSEVVSITLSESVTNIGDGAFCGCSSLASISIPESVASIGNLAFYHCSSLGIVFNYSPLKLSKGSESYGYITKYAKIVIDGNVCEQNGDFFFCPNEKGEYNLSLYTGDERKLKLPNMYKGMNYEIGDYAFYNCSKLENIVIPNSVTNIGNYAFAGCSSLNKLYIEDGENILSLGKGDDWGGLFTTLDTLYMGRNLEYEEGLGGESPFMNNQNLTIVTIGNKVNSINRYLFRGCSKLKEILIPRSVTTIKERSFWGCTSLECITIPSSVEEIEDFAFLSCEKLKRIINHSNLNIKKGEEDNGFVAYYAKSILSKENSIDDFYFNTIDGIHYLEYYNGQNTDLSFPVNYKGQKYIIGEELFKSCASINRVVLSDAVTEIGKNAFYNCKNLKEIILGNSVTNIADYAFWGCSSLTSLTIPNAVTEIGHNAFWGCENLKKIVNASSLDLEKGSFKHGFLAYYADVILQLDASAISVDGFFFKTTNGIHQLIAYDRQDKHIILPPDYNGKKYVIADYAFENCEALESVTISNSVTNIGKYAFKGCYNIKQVSLGNSVTSIGENAFEDCMVYIILNYSSLPITKTNYASYGYLSRYAEKIAQIEDSIGDFCFYTKDNVHYLSHYAGKEQNPNFPDNYKGDNYEIGDYSFYNCDTIVNIAIPNFVTSIGDFAFQNCSKLDSITIPNSVKKIGNGAFATYAKEMSVNVLDLTAWCNIEFSNNKYSSNPLMYNNLYLNGKLVHNLVIPETVTKIKDYAFMNCNSITSIDTGNSLTSIGKEAFYGCKNLEKVYIGNSVIRIETEAFADCNKLTTVINSSNLNISKPNSWQSHSNHGGCIADNAKKIVKANGKIDDYYFYTNNNSTQLVHYDGCKKNLILPEKYNGANYKIGTDAFYGYDSLKSVIIPNSVDEIMHHAFRDCHIHSITIGSGVTSLKSLYDNGTIYYPFNNVPTKIIWLGNTPPSNYKNVKGMINIVPNDKYSFDSKEVVIYPFLSSMFEVNGIKYVPVDLAERTCDIIDYSYSQEIEDLKIGPTVSYKGINMSIKNISMYAFYGNSHIRNLDINCSGMIKDYAFGHCLGLQSATICENITSINTGAFSYCSSLHAFKIPSSVMEIGDKAFECCFSLSKISIPHSTKELGDKVFKECTSLTDFVIEDRDTYLKIGNGLFTDTPLKTVYIGGKITYYSSPFANITSLEKVTITDQEEKISNFQFEGCKNLKDVSVGNNIKSIGNYAFANCTSLRFYTIGENVKNIGEGAFSGCTNIKQFICKSMTPPNCEAQVFNDINKWECTLIVPKGCIPVYQKANQWKDFLFIEDDLSAKSYNVTYIVDGEIFHTETVAYASEITTIDFPIKEGYTFSGWSEIPATMPAQDVTIEGTFTVNSYTITYKVDGEVYATEEVAYGEAIVLKEAPVKEGYIFGGWSEVPETMPATDIEVTGHFEVDGIDAVVTDRLVDVYTLQGMMVKRQIAIDELKNELPKGIYIINGRKIAIK